VGKSTPESKVPIILGGIIIVAGLITLAVFSEPSLPMSDKMSANFKKASYEAWLAYHQFGLCSLRSEKPENTADQLVRELFDQCFEYDRKKLELSGKLLTDDLRGQYNDANAEQERIMGQVDAIFKANGYEDADTILRRKREELIRRRK
jgi:hypothetical protein